MPAKGKNFLTRSQVARQAGVGIESLRFYERKKIIPPPSRSRSGYRLYGDDQLQRLKFIKKAQLLGFSLEEVRELFAMVENPRFSCKTVKSMAEEKIRDVEKKLLDLQNLRKALVDLTGRCDSDKDIRHCPIIESLS